MYYLPDVPEDAPPDELIVDLRERPLVEAALVDLGVIVTRDGEIPPFDLAKLKLTYGFSMAPDLPFVMEIDAVLSELRRRFAARCGGWVPLLGKNRTLSNQFGAYPQTQSQGDFDPVPSGPAGHHRRRPGRRARSPDRDPRHQAVPPPRPRRALRDPGRRQHLRPARPRTATPGRTGTRRS